MKIRDFGAKIMLERVVNSIQFNSIILFNVFSQRSDFRQQPTNHTHTNKKKIKTLKKTNEWTFNWGTCNFKQ